MFVGPTLHGVRDRPVEIEFLPPASCGDLIAAVERGIEWIGLVDGYFGDCASVWHKEILYALSRGCHVWGAASMGALRAAECQAFGMRPIGSIALQFAAGELADDSEVAIVHGPPELDFIPFTEALVDVRATIRALCHANVISTKEAIGLLAAAKASHFTERTVEDLMTIAVARDRRAAVASLYETHRVAAKQADGKLLVAAMQGERPNPRVLDWSLSKSSSLERLMDLTMVRN